MKNVFLIMSFSYFYTKSLNFVVFFLLLFLSSKLFSQEIQRCSVAEIQKKDALKNKKIESNKIRFEQAIQNFLIDDKKNARISAEIIKIPVVVHVIHNRADGLVGGTNNPNISDEQIYSQIRVLNEDFRKKTNTMGFNSNPVGADMEIEFYLVNLDPNGSPTKGITRHYYPNKRTFDIESDRTLISSFSYWDSNKYLNIWVADFNDPYIGYAEFPGAKDFDGLESEDPSQDIDGVFIDHSVFGRQIGTNTTGLYKFGRTVTHEVGHWIGLIHTWGDEFCGTDFVDDTPNTARANNGSVCRNNFSNCNGIRTRDMIENYMDYSPDTCMNIFTEGQKKRARAALELSKRRKRIIEFGKFQLPNSDKLQVKVFPHPSSANDIQIQVLLPDFQDFTIKLYDILGRPVYEEVYKDFPSTIIKLKPEKLNNGNYIMVIASKNEAVRQRIFLN